LFIFLYLSSICPFRPSKHNQPEFALQGLGWGIGKANLLEFLMRRLFVSEKESKRFSAEASERFQKKDNRVHNSTVRKNAKESLFAALHKNYKNYKNLKVEGVCIETVFKKLLSN
jgi:hypothetical protein